QYLADFGRSISAEKVVHLALKAESEGCPEMAAGFWKKAYELETGNSAPAEAAKAPAASTDALTTLSPPRVSASRGSAAIPPFDKLRIPPHLTPGELVTMQPTDAGKSRQHYIDDPAFWGQPKRDGKRFVVTATPPPAQNFYQTRTGNLEEPPSLQIDQALAQGARKFGVFVLDTELYYADALGGEHRTGAQAATVNIENERGDVQPEPRIAIFKALFADGQDLTVQPESKRIEFGGQIGAWLAERLPQNFEALPTARTRAQKAALAAKQEAEGREGEVWVRSDCIYTGGKDTKGQVFVRTKYILTLDVVVLGLTPTTAAGRPFGAIEVGAHVLSLSKDGKMTGLGAVGTGYDGRQMQELVVRHAKTPGRVVITIASQGFTERRQLWQPRFVDFRDDKRPEDCVLSLPKG
ncbi:MAG: ATP-dependent DNA ligase, partial [Planctomycetota bacterium]